MHASTLFRLSPSAFIIVLLSSAILSQCSCSQKSTLDPTDQSARLHNFQLGHVLFQAEVASGATQMRRGLMYRDTLANNQGMLFVYLYPQRLSFWMHNTRIPLDIGYFTSDGVLQEIYPLYPYDTDPVQSKRLDIQYALEMNQGWFTRNKLYPGAVLELEALKKAFNK